MRLVKLLLIVGLLGGAFQLWKGHAHASFEREMVAMANDNGFVPVEMPGGAPRNTAVILAPVDCPSDEAQRADAMAERLTGMGIPNVRSSNYSFETSGPPTPELSQRLERTTFVLNGQIPVVFINGMAKANPTVEEVAAEYRHGR